MRKFVLTILALVAMAAPAAAQLGDISTYADQPGSSCTIVDNQPFAFIESYLIHKNTGGATASQFAITSTGGSTLQLIQIIVDPTMLSLGDQNDLSIAYGGCRTGDVYLANVRYIGSGTSTPCARLTLSAAPTSPIPGEVAMVDCALPSGNLAVPATGQAIINPDITCQCDVAVTETTWGAIKALYR